MINNKPHSNLVESFSFMRQAYAEAPFRPELAQEKPKPKAVESAPVDPCSELDKRIRKMRTMLRK